MRSLKTIIFVATVSLGGLAVAAPAHAVTCSTSNQNMVELRSHADKQRWEEGEAFYLAWRAASCAPDVYTKMMHGSGTIIAFGRGDLVAAMERDALADDALDLNVRVPSTYGYVQLRGFRAVPEAQRVLSGPGPNQPTFKRAATALRLTGRYGGYMHPGTYSIAGKTFTVAVGQPVDLTY